MSPPPLRTFGFHNLTIQVASDDPEDLAWLGEFLGPAFEPADAPEVDGPARQLTLTRDEGVVGEWRPERAQPAVAYVLDTGPLPMPRQPHEAGALTLDEEFSTWYREASSGIDLIDVPGHTCPEDGLPRRARIALMRAVREYAMHAARRRGATMLHASAVSSNGCAVAFAGRKTAGKTSLLSAALAMVEGTRLLANDRVAVVPRRTGWRATGIASIVSVRAGMLDLLPGVRARLMASACGITHRAGAAAPPRVRDDGGIGLTPTQYAGALDTTLDASADLVSVAFPRLDVTHRGIDLVPLGATEAARRLHDALFSAGDLGARSLLFDVPEAGTWPSAADHAERTAALAGSLRCVELRVGPDAYRSEVLAPVIESLLR